MMRGRHLGLNDNSSMTRVRQDSASRETTKLDRKALIAKQYLDRAPEIEHRPGAVRYAQCRDAGGVCVESRVDEIEA